MQSSLRASRALALSSLLFLGAGVTACSSDSGGDAAAAPINPVGGLPLLGADCDPLVPTQCGYPIPSDVWTVADATTPTGRRVAFGPTTLPKRNDFYPTDPTPWNRSDGFSAGQTILTHFPGATITGLPTQDTLETSITKDSPTVLIDAETGELIPHFSELDMSTGDDDQRAFMIRPVVRLKDKTRYIVAIRRVLGADGAALAPTPVFQALRDGSPSGEPSVRRRRDLYADIFARLEKAGIAKADLQLAWDYTTASRENNTGWLVHMRDEALATVGTLGPSYVIKTVEENPNAHIRRRITATMTVPMYLDKLEPGGKLVLGSDGLPKQNGTATFDVLIHIPNSATTGKPGALLQVGHGLFGEKEEAQNGYLAELADTKNFVAFGINLTGMAHDDFPFVADTLVGDIGGFDVVVNRQHQGLVNSLLAMRMMMGRFVDEPLVQFNGKSAIDPTHRYYRGDSQGGIFGGTYMAITTDVTRGLLGEPGFPYNLLLNRSADFGPYFVIIKGVYHRQLDLQLGLTGVQMLWDRTEPDGYVPYITSDMLPNTPAHEVLIHVAIHDHQVTNLGAHMLARTVGAKNLEPLNRPVWGVPTAAGPVQGSGMVEFDFGVPDVPHTNQSPSTDSKIDPHDWVRETQASHDQTDHFLRDGVIETFCGGKCVFPPNP